MSILFPNSFKSSDTFFSQEEKLAFTIDSGKSALRVALKSFNLPVSSKIAIPAFSCNAVYHSVLEEGLTPVFFDLKSDNTYWTDYTTEQLLKENIKVVIITHLYGFIQPDTTAIIEFCKINSIKIIHDAAQSFAVDESVFGSDLIVYSFSAGKSSTAAAGGEVCNLNNFKIELKKTSAIQELKSKLFFNARYIDYYFPKFNARLNTLLEKICSNETGFFDMTAFQKTKALQAKYIVKHYSNERIERYDILKQGVLNSNELKIAYSSNKGLYFKMVLFAPNNVVHFIDYLKANRVGHYRLGQDINVAERKIESLPLFAKNYFNFVEISTERTIALEEINRVATVLANYK